MVVGRGLGARTALRPWNRTFYGKGDGWLEGASGDGASLAVLVSEDTPQHVSIGATLLAGKFSKRKHDVVERSHDRRLPSSKPAVSNF
jgi:hypothetical protein